MDEESREYFEDDDFIEAVTRFKKMVRNKTVSYFDVFEFEGIADFFMDEGRLRMAKKAIVTGLHIHPDATSLLIKKAQILVLEGKAKKCLELIHFVEKIESTNADVYLIKGSALNLLGDTDRAVHAYEKAIKYDTEEPDDILYNIGITFGQTNENKLAIHYLERANLANPQNEMVLYELGYFYDRDLQHEKSIVSYNKYLDIDPFNSSVWYNLGIAHNRSGDYLEAIKAYDFAIVLQDNFLQAYFNKANTYSNNEQYNEAIACYEEYIERDKDNDDAYCYLAECYYNLNKNEESLLYYQTAIKINRQNAEAWHGSGLIMWRENKLAQSHTFLKKATKLEPDNDEYWGTYARVCSELNFYKDAVSAYTKATKIAPENFEYWIAYSELLHKKGETAKAINILKKAGQVGESSAHINYRLTAYLLENENNVEAASHFEKALNIDFSSYKNLFEYYPEASKVEMISGLIRKYQSNKPQPLNLDTESLGTIGTISPGL